MPSIKKSVTLHCGLSSFYGQLTLRKAGHTLEITNIYTQDQVLDLSCQWETWPVTSINLMDLEEDLSGVKKMVIARSIKKILMSDFCLPDLEELVVEEGAPFFAQGTNLFTKEGKLLNCFQPGSFPDPEEISLPFDPSSDMEIQGDTLFSLHFPVDTLFLPPEVKFLDPFAFRMHAPRRIVSFHLLSSSGDFPVLGVGNVKVLEIMSPEASLSRSELLKWEGLESISLPNGHNEYLAKDGFLYEEEGKALVYLPPCHPKVLAGSLSIPEGVQRLGDGLLSHLSSLKRVEMPDSVKEIGADLFAGCENLEDVRLSDSLTRIPGNMGPHGRSYYGTFHQCTHLSHVHLPRQLTCIERAAFQDSGISQLELPEGLKVIESLAFATFPALKSLSLPRSLERIESYAFSCETSLRIRAYEGTAKGLLSSVNYMKPRAASWVEALFPNGESIITFPIPRGSVTELKPLLTKVWDGETLSLEALFQCIPYTLDADIRDELILLALLHQGKPALETWGSYRHKNYKQLGMIFIQRDQGESLSRFLEVVKPNKATLTALVEVCRKEKPELLQFFPG